MNDEQKTWAFNHFGLDPDDTSALAQAVEYLVKGESSNDFIRRYARGYAELAERYAAGQEHRAQVALRAEKMEKALPALENLKKHQGQLDESGVRVAVSRQALCEMVRAFDEVLGIYSE